MGIIYLKHINNKLNKNIKDNKFGNKLNNLIGLMIKNKCDITHKKDETILTCKKENKIHDLKIVKQKNKIKYIYSKENTTEIGIYNKIDNKTIIKFNTIKVNNSEINKQTEITNDINYSYSYTVTYNGKSEVYLGKKIDEKEKFTLVKDGITTNYAILNDNYLVQKGDVYTITEKPSVFFKYCDVEKVLLLIKDKEEKNSYNVTNNELKNNYKDNLLSDNLKDNIIKINISNDILKSIDLDFSNYYSAITNQKESLTIHMEFADIGTTEDFEIKVSW